MLPRLSAFVLLSLSLIVSFHSKAQTAEPSIPKWMLASLPADRYAAWQLYLKHHAPAGSKTTGMAHRLIAIYNAQYTSSGTASVADSAAYHYSGPRGTNPNGQTMTIGGMRMDMLFDSGISYRGALASGSYSPIDRVMKSFNAQQLPDSFIYQNNGPSGWQNISKGIYSYYPSGKECVYRAESWNPYSGTWAYPTLHCYAYNAAGDITLDSFQSWDLSAGTLVNDYRLIYTYDGLGRLNTMLQQSWSRTGANWTDIQKDSISYTATGKVAAWSGWYFSPGSSTWLKDYRDLSYYNSSDFEITAVHQFAKNGDWVSSDSAVHNVLNTAGLPVFDSVYRTYPTLRLDQRLTNTYTPTNQVSTVLRELYNGSFLNSDRQFSFYDAADQLIRHYNQSWDGTAWVFDANNSEQRYYYEPYSTTGIRGTGRPAASVDAYLFPVPAANTITLAMSLPLQQAIKAAVYDATGKLQLSWKESASAGLYTKDLSLTALPAGTYYLIVDGEQCHWSCRFVVAH